MSSWTIWIIVAFLIALFYRPLLIPAAIIFGIGLGLGWW